MGNTHRHSILYRREREFIQQWGQVGAYAQEKDNLLPLGEEHRSHYTSIYETRNVEVKLFFDLHGRERLFQGRLEDPELWTRMGNFFGIRVADGYTVHANDSRTRKPNTGKKLPG